MDRSRLLLLATWVIILATKPIVAAEEGTPRTDGLVPTQDLATLPVLRPNDLVEGTIGESDPRIETETLTRNGYSDLVVRAKSYRIEVPKTAPYAIELRSDFFDSYLVLRDEAGSVLAEDDDGLIRVHARIVLPNATAGESFRIDACGLHDGTGPFELRLFEGTPPELSSNDKRTAELADARRSLEAVETALGKEHPSTATSLNGLAALLYGLGDFDAARPLYERALTIREKTLGNEHPSTAQSLNNLALLLEGQGDFDAARPLFERALAVYEKTLGAEHPSTAHSLNNLAVLLYELGDFDAARPLYERALAVYEKRLGAEHPRTATSLNNLAMLLKDLGDFDAARPLFERNLAICEKTLGAEHPDTAMSLSNLALLLKDLGDFDAARPLFERALTIREKTLGAEHPSTATSLTGLALLLKDLGDFDAARPLFERALAIREKTLGAEHPHTAISLGNLAVLLKDLGDFDAARPLYERALAICEKTLGAEHPHTATSLNNLAMLLKDLGDFDAARPLFERALAIREKTLGDEHPRTAVSLANLASLLRRLGDSDAARPLFERALAVHEKTLGAEHPLVATSLGNLAALLLDLGDFDAARSLSERALAIREKTLGDEHPDTAISLGNLALLLQAQGDLDAARPLYERALAVHEKTLGAEHPHTAIGLANLARLLKDLGDFDAARPLYERALVIFEKTLGAEHPSTARSLNNLIALLCEQGAFAEALALSQRAMQGQQAHRERLTWSLTEAERLLFAKTQRTTLETFLSIPESIAIQEGVLRYNAILAWKGQVLRSLTRSRGAAMATLQVADRRRVEQLQHLQARLSKALFDKDVDDRDKHRRLLATLREQRKAIELELTRSLGATTDSGSPTVAELRSALPANSVLVDFFVHRVYEPARRDSTGKATTAGRFSAPRLSAWIVQPRSEGPVRHVDLGDAAPIQVATRAFLDSLTAKRGIAQIATEPGDNTNDQEANRRLRELLWDPLRGHVGAAALVFVSPDGFLGTLPFETLQRKDGSYLIEHHAFVYSEASASLVGIAGSNRSSTPDDAVRSTADAADLFCVGNVDYRKRDSLAWRDPIPERDRPDDGATRPDPSAMVAAAEEPGSSIHSLARGGFPRRWTSLPATDEEARAISEIHEETFESSSTRLVLGGREVTEERLKYELPRHEIVHLATHGFFQPEGLPSMWRQVMADDGQRRMEMFDEEEKIVGLMPGLMSGLVLAGANRKPGEDRDDGFLTAEEISFLDLSNIKLVVLSACETALGKSEAGEGMLGLRRTFRQSGARTVISSLWKVSDEATSQLMQSFYERLWLDGDTTLDALRGAQLDMLKKNRIENDGDGLPSTWGAFVLDGAWQ